MLLKRVDQPGTSPKRRRLVELGAVVDADDVFAGICAHSGLPMLGRVDPYGDLVLTAAEMPQLLGELETELGRAAGATERALLTEVRRLAEQCAAEAGTELHLEGD
ncbi:hypothetical protein ACFVWG_08225 [Kribbella sp. NPDC058245]|uniref:hypothetical protein n=1 Tax=Kribbella sp. NPDC058245 TaxID=3346399 RepID=UPI0036E7F246